MRASLTAAGAAFITFLTAGGTQVSAQAFDTSPQYEPYSTEQRVPRVNLPKQTSTGMSLGPSSMERLGVPPSANLEPTASPPSRRTDAGALRRDRNGGKANAANAPAERKGTPPAPAEQQKYQAGTVLEGAASVYDGQNILVQGVPVRLDGAEAPALAQQCMTRKSLVWNCGGRAAERLRELVSPGKARCVVTEPLGNGAAAICSVRGVSDLGAAMVSEGLAVSNGHDKGRYSIQQTTARSMSRGMWVGPFEAPWTWRQRHGQ